MKVQELIDYNGFILSKRYYYTDDDIEFLKKYYPVGDWDKINKRFPTLSKKKIYSICYKHGIKYTNSKQDLSVNFSSKRWTTSEDDIIRECYGSMNIDNISELLPNRSHNAIILRASKLGVKSKFKSDQEYSNEEIEYILNNWQLYSDVTIAKELGRTPRAIKWMRANLGLYRKDQNSKHYENISKFLRGNIYDWKLKSMQECNFQCVLTGSKDFHIHHLYNFQYILNEFCSSYDFNLDADINTLSKEEQNKLIFTFNDFHNKFGLGVCVSKDLHILFHHIYGRNLNTPKQWNEFMDNYRKGKYNQSIA